ncbi:MAG: hypothetical protein AAF502_07335 [Bacteroidota bacterium]
MSSNSFNIESYSVSVYRDGSGGGASSTFDATIHVKGEGSTVFIHFLNEDHITSDNVWNSKSRFGRIYLRHRLLPVVIDLLRNEKPVYCKMSEVNPASCQLSTSAEPVGEGES